MDIMEAIRGRRSIRKYTPKPVPDDVLNQVLEAARLAPSWANGQCWRLIVVRDAQTRQRLADSLRSGRPGFPNRGADAIRVAPVTIVACGQRNLSGFHRGGDQAGQPATDKGEWWYMFDVALAMANLTLAAHALGLGTLHIGMFDAKAVADLLKVPPETAVVEVMPLGYPDEAPDARPRMELAEFVSHERFSPGKKA